MIPQGNSVTTHNRPKVSFRILLISLIVILSYQSFSQREADRWYFGIHGGLDFSTGEPVIMSNPYHSSGTIGTMCDSLSNLLFYSDLFNIHNSNFEVMENGDDLIVGGGGMSNLTIPWPGSDSLYIDLKVKDANDGP
ncbi:MAG: hypothetical protein QM503_15600, partial [Bacteroidota bacterium]